jgi:hypothetical protein
VAKEHFVALGVADEQFQIPVTVLPDRGSMDWTLWIDVPDGVESVSSGADSGLLEAAPEFATRTKRWFCVCGCRETESVMAPFEFKNATTVRGAIF